MTTSTEWMHQAKHKHEISTSESSSSPPLIVLWVIHVFEFTWGRTWRFAWYLYHAYVPLDAWIHSVRYDKCLFHTLEVSILVNDHDCAFLLCCAFLVANLMRCMFACCWVFCILSNSLLWLGRGAWRFVWDLYNVFVLLGACIHPVHVLICLFHNVHVRILADWSSCVCVWWVALFSLHASCLAFCMLFRVLRVLVFACFALGDNAWRVVRHSSHIFITLGATLSFNSCCHAFIQYIVHIRVFAK